MYPGFGNGRPDYANQCRRNVAFSSMPMGDMRNTRIVSPAMYPDIFFSVPFQKELIYSPLYIDERGDTVTFYNYLVSGPERLALVADPSQVER